MARRNDVALAVVVADETEQQLRFYQRRAA
jgi:hypothetical protein